MAGLKRDASPPDPVTSIEADITELRRRRNSVAEHRAAVVRELQMAVTAARQAALAGRDPSYPVGRASAEAALKTLDESLAVLDEKMNNAGIKLELTREAVAREAEAQRIQAKLGELDAAIPVLYRAAEHAIAACKLRRLQTEPGVPGGFQGSPVVYELEHLGDAIFATILQIKQRLPQVREAMAGAARDARAEPRQMPVAEPPKPQDARNFRRKRHGAEIDALHTLGAWLPRGAPASVTPVAGFKEKIGGPRSGTVIIQK
jgi:hypothetical protein